MKLFAVIAVLLVTARTLHAAIPSSITSWWKMDETNYVRVDAIGPVQLLDSPNTGVTNTTGKLGLAASFVAASQNYLEWPDYPEVSVGAGQSFTCGAWVRLASKTTVRDIFGKWNSTDNKREYLLAYSSSVNRFAFFVSSNGTASASVNADALGSPSTNVWYHVVGVYDHAQGQLGIYINGTSATNNLAYASGIADSTSAFRIGYRDNVGATSYMDGDIDEAFLAPVALTPSEINSIYNSGAGITPSARAANQIVAAASTARNDVQKAFVSAAPVDTVSIPSGTSSWTTTVTSDRGCHITGAGTNSTVFIDDIAPVSGSRIGVPVLKVVGGGEIGKVIPRISHFKLQGGTNYIGSTNINYDGALVLSGAQKVMVIHDVVFDSLVAASLAINGPIGVGYNIDIKGGNVGLLVFHSGWNNGVHGDKSWTDSNYQGTTNMWVLEDSRIHDMAFAGASDGWKGARYCIRHSDIVESYSTSHGTDTTGRDRGMRWVELYSNTYLWTTNNPTQPDWPQAIYLRGGSGVFYSNVVSGTFQKVGIVANYRSFGPGTEGYPWTTWHAPCNVNTNDLSCSPWDGNTNTNGYPCLDQIGRGTGDLITGEYPNQINVDNGGIATWPRQALDPIYFWSNSLNGATNTAIGNQSSGVITLSTDYYLNSAKPGYTALAYPHPLIPAALSMSPSSGSVTSGQQIDFDGTGGSGIYVLFEMVVNNSNGSINSSTGLYTAGNTAPSSDTVRVWDSYGNYADASVSVASSAPKPNPKRKSRILIFNNKFQGNETSYDLDLLPPTFRQLITNNLMTVVLNPDL